MRYFGRLLLLARPYWRGQLSAILLGTIVGIAGMIPPYLSKVFIDTVYPARDFALLDALAIGLLVVTISSTLITSLQTYYSDVVGMRMARSTELLFFNQLQHMPVEFFDDRAVGEIHSRFNDVSLALQTLSNVFRTLLKLGMLQMHLALSLSNTP